jgi:hypothetical protein
MNDYNWRHSFGVWATGPCFLFQGTLMELRMLMFLLGFTSYAALNADAFYIDN